MNWQPFKQAIALIFAFAFASMGWGAYVCGEVGYCQEKIMQKGITIGAILATALLAWSYWPHVKPARLTSKSARILFLIGIVMTLPWIFGRLIPEVWENSSAWGYLEQSFLLPINGSDYATHWFDRLAPLGWLALVAAFWWRHVSALIARISGWINGQ